jgi:hypothetical protein
LGAGVCRSSSSLFTAPSTKEQREGKSREERGEGGRRETGPRERAERAQVLVAAPVSGWEEEGQQGGKRRRETEGEQAEVEEGGAERRRSAGQGAWRLRRGPCCGGVEGR